MMLWQWSNDNGTVTLQLGALETVTGHALLLLVFPTASFQTVLPVRISPGHSQIIGWLCL